jgi:cyanophycinase
MPGLLVLNGGEEFQEGNEPQDRELVAAARSGPAWVLATAAARQGPELAAANARSWFGALGLEVEELPVRSRADAETEVLAERARRGGFFYLTGGDPGLVVQVLAHSRVWSAIAAAWREGAALAGSSAGAMALGGWTLVMARWPQHRRRRAVPALGLVPGIAVLPHYDRFGAGWLLEEQLPGAVLVGLDERTAVVFDGGWRAVGPGVVTVVRAGTATRFPAPGRVEGLPPPQGVGMGC